MKHAESAAWVRVCPWCGGAPTWADVTLSRAGTPNAVVLRDLGCRNPKCRMQPKTPPVAPALSQQGKEQQDARMLWEWNSRDGP